MSNWSRFVNVFRRDRLDAELDEEMQAHIDEAIAQGLDPVEARRAFGSTLRRREDSRDIKLSVWIESLRSDLVFGVRQLRKNPAVSAAAILSLGLALGACTSAFRLLDALLLRPLPVADPGSLYALEYLSVDGEGKRRTADSFEYPTFRQLRKSVEGEAELMAVSYSTRIDVTYGSDREMEKVYRQHVSGWMFGSLGLQPAQGRLFSASDDVTPGAHPYAVLSHEYWMRRFAGDPKVIGKSMRIGVTLYEIAGVCEPGFTGTETGTMTDLFIPTMMNARAIESPNWFWFRILARIHPGVSVERTQQKLQAIMTSLRRERVKTWGPGNSPAQIDAFVNSPLSIESASAGISSLQRDYRQPLTILALVAALVLLIACANVANLMTAQATARAREMALRVSIGAGRLRLVQLVMIESALIASAATILGGALAWWAAPFVVTMIQSPEQQTRLDLPMDWRVLAFGSLLAASVAALFGAAPAIRASAVRPMTVLRGGSGGNPNSRRRLMQLLTAAQMAFCILVLFVTGLFLSTFRKLSNQPTGFQTKGVLTLNVVSTAPQAAEFWDQNLEHLRSLSRVESVARSSWPLMSGNFWKDQVWIGGQVRVEEQPPYFLGVSPRWFETMKIPLIDGREFRAEDTSPGSAIVNEAFAQRYFNHENPLGRNFETVDGAKRNVYTIVGYARNARYGRMREEMGATVYIPVRPANDEKGSGDSTYIVRLADGGDAGSAAASMLRQEVNRANPRFRVSEIHSQEELVNSHLIRERLLAMLSMFFAAVALTLAGIGLFGVMQYAALQRRREIGIRMALGARAGHVARRVTAESFAALSIGALVGVVAGWASASLLESLLFGVRGHDPSMIAAPVAILLATGLLAAVSPVLRAVRLDPSLLLRSE
jgi:predicted permease